MNTHKITNRKTGAVLEGEAIHESVSALYLRIDGTTATTWLGTDEWDIEELPKPVELPTEPGLYRFERGFNIYTLTGDGWQLTNTGFKCSEEGMAERGKILGPLVRLVEYGGK